MSNKGAIRKSSSKDIAKSSSLSKGKSKEEDENNRKSNTVLLKKSQSSEHRGDRDKAVKVVSSSSTSRLSKTSTKDGNLQRKVPKELGIPSTSRSIRSSSSINTKPTASSKRQFDTNKKPSTTSSLSNVRPKEKVHSVYSEKRGLSTVYVPHSTTDRLKGKIENRTNSINKDRMRSKNVDSSKAKGIPRERKLSRTLSPSEIKMLHSTMNLDATQRRGQINSQSDYDQESDDYNYEDDFEDYESDFQECTESDETEVSEESNSSLQEEPIELKSVKSGEHKVEEEHMLDSGHYELAEARKRAAKIESMNADQAKSSLLELRQSTVYLQSNKGYSEDRVSENKSLPSSTDEGFEDSRSGDFTRTPPLSQVSIIDFRKTKNNRNSKVSTKVLSRGEELLEMIKLDVMEWSLLECSPIPYEEFILCYGKLDTQQMSTQTGDDNSEMQTQTDKVTMTNKWTQFPVTCRTNLKTKEDLHLFRMDQIGVGTDEMEILNSGPVSFDALRLSDFINRAGRLILSLLEERKLGRKNFRNEEHNLEFSNSVLKLAVNSITFLAGRPVTIIHYSEVFNKILLTIHASNEEEIETSSKQDYITDCCIGCVWNISEPSMPIKLFFSPCPITACCFHSMNYNVVFAGLQDGSISLWDLKEDAMYHQRVTDKANDLDWTIRSPTYTTAANSDSESSISPIVAIRVLSKSEEESFSRRTNKFVPVQIFSLDDEGVLIIWTVLYNMGLTVDDLGLSYWGDIRLVKSQELHLEAKRKTTKIKSSSFVDLLIDPINFNNIYAATNTTDIVHATCIGNKTNPPIYEAIKMQISGNITCMDICPFEKSFFLAGCDDGTVRLHSSKVEEALLQLKDENCKAEVRAVRWSKSKIFTIYVLDIKSRIHIWDLKNSDVHVSHTINLRERGPISCMELSPCRTEKDMIHQYFALGGEAGSVEIHELKSDFYHSLKEDSTRDLNMFLQYVAMF